jgi:glycosyltransferase involved in cell wall biosynthesis
MKMIHDLNGEVILTIAIPTYNGASTLQQTLDSVVTQLQPGVDILISDNASTDGTAEIVQRYQADYPQIRYRRNSENVGADQNFELIVKHAVGKFVWLFSDDDVFERGAILNIVTIIEQAGSGCGLIVVDCQVFSFIQNRILIDGLNTVGASYCLPAGQYLFLDPVRDMIGVASTILLRRRFLDGVDCAPLYGTSHMHIGLAAYSSTIGYTLVLDKKLFSFRRDGMPRWTALSYDIDFYLGYERAALFGIGNLRSIKQLVKQKVWKLPRFLILIRMKNRSIPWGKLIVATFSNDLKVYRYGVLWLILPLLFLIGITPPILFWPLRVIWDWKKRTKL